MENQEDLRNLLRHRGMVLSFDYAPHDDEGSREFVHNAVENVNYFEFYNFTSGRDLSVRDDAEVFTVAMPDDPGEDGEMEMVFYYAVEADRNGERTVLVTTVRH